jgi:hypothetical protein
VVNKVNSAYEEIQKLQDKIQQKGKRAHHWKRIIKYIKQEFGESTEG